MELMPSGAHQGILILLIGHHPKRLYYREPFSIFSVLAERDWRFSVVESEPSGMHEDEGQQSSIGEMEGTWSTQIIESTSI